MVQKLACPEKSPKSDNLQWERTTAVTALSLLLTSGIIKQCRPLVSMKMSSSQSRQPNYHCYTSDSIVLYRLRNDPSCVDWDVNSLSTLLNSTGQTIKPRHTQTTEDHEKRTAPWKCRWTCGPGEWTWSKWKMCNFQVHNFTLRLYYVLPGSHSV